MSCKKILITGSEGFIGKPLTKKLKSQGHTVFEADKITGVDLTDQTTVENLPDVDIVIHLAAFNGTKYFYSHPFDVITHNILPTHYLLQRYAGKVSKFVFSGTSESYAGAVDNFGWDVPTDETVPLVIADTLNPRWSYGGSKITNELQVTSAHCQFSQDFTIIRYHNVYGPEQTHHFIPEFIERVKKGDYSLHGWDNTRSFIYVDDAVSATVDIIFNDKCTNQIIHVGNEEEITIKSLAEKIMKKLNISGELILKDAPAGSTSRRCPDTTKLKTLTNYVQSVDIDQGIENIIKSM